MTRDYVAYVMTLSHFKTFKSLTCKVIGLMGLHGLVEATEMGRTARDTFPDRAEEGMRVHGGKLSKCLKQWTVLMN